MTQETLPLRELDFSDVRLYAVTPEGKSEAELVPIIEKLLAGGVNAIQLRSKKLSDRQMMELGKKIKKACEKTGAHFIVDNRVDLALALDADGVHVGHTDLQVPIVREMIGHRKIIGASSHSISEAIQNQRDGADYVSCGPIWATPTKPDYPAVGVKLVGLYKAAITIPFVAIGGIDKTNIDEVLAAGATCVAMVRELFGAADPEQAAKKFREKIISNKKS